MKEAQKAEYFLPGCMMKFYNVFPVTLNMANLHERQQAFLVYLLAIIPSKETWTLDVAYQTEKAQIEELDIKDVVLSQNDMDLIRIQGLDITTIKKERLTNLKKQKTLELNERYGIKDTEKKSKSLSSVNDPVFKELSERKQTNKTVFEMLNAKDNN